MAREIVITSVPRGVKLGRTGFQVAMQTAGLRDDLAAQLEKMAGYRHLPTGVPNPVCYFHRVTKTFAGPVSVLGRIVDAGVDFSNRSNKLAHMVVLEAADVGQVASSTPAAVLAAVEGRLAATWRGPAEERREPFSIAGVQASQPARCGLWQQVMGDAGWAGVLAERAVRGQPTLIVGRDSSPESCRKMLALFQEALAIVPPAKRWGVTFDTATLAPEGVLWRGTYAGSPESQTAQPGVLVIDLARPQPIPQSLDAGELVTIAREGPPSPAMPRPGGVLSAPSFPGSGRPTSEGTEVGGAAVGGRTNPATHSGPGVTPPPAPFRGGDWPGAPSEKNGERRAPSYRWLIWTAGVMVAALGLAILGIGGFLVLPGIRQQVTLKKFQAYVEQKTSNKETAPTGRDLQLASGIPSNDLTEDQAKAAIGFLNDWLVGDEAEKNRRRAASTKEELCKLLCAVQTVMQPARKPEELANSIQALCCAAEPGDCTLVAARHNNGFQTWKDLSARVREASESRIARRKAFDFIRKYAEKIDGNTPPDRACYCRALGIDESTMDETCVSFLNDVLKYERENVPSVVEAPERLFQLWLDTKAVLTNAPQGSGRGIQVLIEGKDGNFSNLFDALHPGAFEDYEKFRLFVRDLDELMKLSEVSPENRGDKTVGAALWEALKVGTSITDRLGEDPEGRTFAQRVKKQDVADIATLRTFLESIYPQNSGERTVAKSSPTSELQKAIAEFRRRVAQGNVVADLDAGKSVELFPAALSACQKVAHRKDVGANLRGVSGGAHVFIKDEQVLKLLVGEKLTLQKGDNWATHKAAAMFLPLGFSTDAASSIGSDDWIVLSPPVERPLPSDKDGPTLHTLVSSSEPVKVPLPSDVIPSLKLAQRTSMGLDLPLTVGLQVDSTGTAGVLTFMKSIRTVLASNQEAPVDYVLTERVEIGSTGASLRLVGRDWRESQLRMKWLEREQGKQVAGDEAAYIGYKPLPGRKDTIALRDVSDAALVALVQATVGVWLKPKAPFLHAGEVVAKWTPGDKDSKPSTLFGWRKHLRDWLATQPGGFADACRDAYGADAAKVDSKLPRDPGVFAWRKPIDGEKDSDYEREKQKALQDHEKIKAAYKLALAEHFETQVEKLEALRKYVEKRRPEFKDKDPSAEVAAACFLVEIDGLIVAKVCRAELKEVLKRIPVGALVEGTVPPREWDSWVADGNTVPMAKELSVPELKFVPAKLLDPPKKPAAGAATPDRPDRGAATP